MTTAWLLLLVNIAATWCCSTIHVSPPNGDTVIGRTMELGSVGGETNWGGLLFGADPSDPSLPVQDPWTISVHRRDEEVGKDISALVCGVALPGKKQPGYGYVSVDGAGHLAPELKSAGLTAGSPTSFTVSTDGMNEKGLTVSTQVFHQSVYMQPSAPEASGTTNVCFMAFADWVLRTFDSVKSLREALHDLKIVGPSPGFVEKALTLTGLAGLHWSIDDASEHIVLEVLDGVIKMHNNTVGVMTNQPDFTWHLRNLNNFVNLRSEWPSNLEIQVQTNSSEGSEFEPEVELVPDVTKAGHGFNLLGLPGDYSPPSRFVRLFYLRQYAMLRFNPPKKRKYKDSIALVTSLLNNVFINKGTVPDRKPGGVGEYTQYTVLKIPSARLFFYKDYVGTQWRKVRLDKLGFSPKEGALPITPVRLVEDRVSIKDVTALFTASGSSTCEPDDDDDDASSCES